MAEVVAWTEAQIAKGDMANDGGRLRITSLNAMAEQVAADEPGDAHSVLANIERLSERWARKNPEGKAETARTYASRAKTTIEAYFAWSAAPDKYDPKKVLGKRGDSSGAQKQAKKPKPIAPQVVATQPQPDAPMPSQVSSATHGDTRNFPLGVDRSSILFQLPVEGVTFQDVKKFAVHLLTLAKDFDISDEDQAQVFALVVRGGK